MRFLDANVFIYAFLKAKHKLKAEDEAVKEAAKSIISRVNKGERVVTTVVHMIEVFNFAEDWLPIDEALKLEGGLLSNDAIEVEAVDREAYISSIDLAKENSIGLNDGLAISVMEKNGISEIYSFDKHFEKIKGIKRVTK